MRLLNPSAFDRVFKEPYRTGNKNITILGCKNSCTHPRLGIIVAKKNVRYAVKRNLFKRLVREQFRLHQNQMPAMDFVVIARPGLGDLERTTIRRALETLWLRYFLAV
jgi:ribonuclease P protein component